MAPLCICNGVIRSGSTWAFNVCRELYCEVEPARKDQIISTYLDQLPLEQLITNHWPHLRAPTVIKTHLPGAAALRAIVTGSARAVYTYRDPRDCVASDLLFMAGSFEDSIRRISRTFAPLRWYMSNSNCLLIQYEQMMTGREQQIRRIADHLKLAIDEQAIRRIDEKTNLQSSGQICEELKDRPADRTLEIASHRVDPTTQLHENHLHGGTIGRWKRELSKEQIAVVNEHFAEWLVDLGYEMPAPPAASPTPENNSASHNNRAIELAGAGLLIESVAEFRRALELAPEDPEVLVNLGVVLLKLNRHEEAVAVCSKSARLQPASAQAWGNLGIALRATGQPQQAIEAYKRATALEPLSAETHMNLGVALDAVGQRYNAIAAYRRAIAIDPNLANAHYNLANALADSDDPEAAADGYRRAIQLRDHFVAAHSNLGKALTRLGRIDEAMGCYNRAIELDPQSAQPRWNRGLAQLLQGNFEQGWDGYEWRNRQLPRDSPLTPQLQWNGESLKGRTILLHTEQGLGDAVQMVRYVPRVSARGRRVILQCHHELIEIFKTLTGVHALLAHGDPPPAWDVHCPLMSLPRAFGTRLDSIPADIPYLVPDPSRVENWQERLGAPRGQRIGLAWAGAPEHQYDRQRSINLSFFAPLFDLPSVQFFSLQKGAAAKQMESLATGNRPIDYTTMLVNYAETAALISQMDLVISVDTSVAHVAGAMGKPVWMLLAYAPDWRWLLQRSDSPWYPTMRLFRQPIRGDWASVITRVANELKKLT